MTFFAETGSFSWSTAGAGQTIPVTGLSGQPKVVIFWMAGRNTAVDAVGGGNNQILSVGFAISSTVRFSASGLSNDGGTNSVCNVGTANDAIMLEPAADETIAAALDLSSMDANGFTAIIDTQTATAKRVHYLAIGGSDISVAAGRVNDPTSTGNQTTSGLGIDPDFLFTLNAGAFAAGAFDATDAATNAGLGFGFTDGTNSYSVMGFSRDAQTEAHSARYARTDEIVSYVSGTTPDVTGRVSFVSFGTGQFTVNWVETTGGAATEFAYLAIEGGQHHVGNFLSQTSTGAFTETGIGFTPVAALFGSHCKAESTSNTKDADNHLSLGAADGTNQGAQSHLDVDAADPTQVTTAVEFDSVYARLATDAIAGTVDLSSFGSGQLNLDQSDADPDQALIGYWAMAGNAATLTREQEGFRWRADDGSESAASWLAAQDTNVSRAADEITRLRMLTDVSGDAPAEGLKLQYRRQGATTWRDVPVV